VIVYEMINNSAADCPISVKFGTAFDCVTPDVLQTFKGQGHSVKTLSAVANNMAIRRRFHAITN